MAKIHNPQDQDGSLLINQTTFDGEVTARKDADNAEILAREGADNVLQGNIDTEKADRIKADITLQCNIDAEKTAREEADAVLQANIDAEIERATTIESVLSTVIEDEIQRAKQKGDELQSNINDEVTERKAAVFAEETERKGADDKLQAKIDAHQVEINALIAANQAEALTRFESDTLLKSGIEDINGAKKVSFLSNVPETTVSWVGIAINEVQGSNIIGDKLVKAIEFKTTAAVEGSCFLAVYTPGAGTPPAKNLIALSEQTTINAGTTIFEFATPFSWNQTLELYVVDSKNNAPSISNGDPAMPTVSITSPAIADTNGSTWKRLTASQPWGNAKYTFHIIYHLAGQIDIVKSSLTEKINTEITARTELAGQVEAEVLRAGTAEAALAAKDSLIESTLSKLNEKINFIGDTVIIGNEGLLTDAEKTQANADGFRLVSPKTAYIKSIKLQCRSNNAPAVYSYLKISDNENNLIAVSDNNNLHENNAIHVYNFNKVVKLTEGETYKFIFVSDKEGESSVSPSPCIRTTINVADDNTTFNREALYGGKIINFDGTDTDINAQAIIEIEFITNVLEKIQAIIDALPHHEDNRYKFTVSNYIQGDGNTSGTIVLALNNEDAQIITANATCNSKQFEPQINGNELTLQFMLESTDNGGNIIVNAVCDSSRFDNAQYVCYVMHIDFPR